MKRIGAFLLALTLCFLSTGVLSLHAAAADEPQRENAFAAERAVSDAVSRYVGTGSEADSALVQGEDLSMGSPINAYEYTADGALQKLDFVLYPIFKGTEVIAVATVYEIESGRFVAQISTDFLYGIRNGETVTILYDATTCYRYDSDGLTKVVDYSEPVETRGILPQMTGVSAQAMECVEVRAALPLQTSSINSDLVYSCGVSFVGQGSHNTLCWAASVACIGNYLSTEYNYTAVSLAESLLGDSYDSDDGRDVQYARSALYTAYRILYTAHYSRPSDGTIVTNLSNDYPVYAAFETGSLVKEDAEGHACVVFQINLNAGSILLMDPEEGTRTCYATSSGVYQYIKNTNAKLYTLNAYASKY